MIRVLEIIPRSLFEPFTAGAVLGLAAAFFQFRKKRGFFFYLILATLCFMFVWRLSFHPLMLSSRYFSVLIIPAIIFTVWFCFQSQMVCNWFPNCKLFSSTSFKQNLCRMIPWFLIVALSLASLIKTFHYNSYSGHVQTICDAFLADSQGKNTPVYLYTPQDREQTRIAYYCNIRDFAKVIPFKSNNPVNVTREELRDRVKMTINISGIHYFFIQQKAGSPVLTAKDLNLPGDADNWKEIKRVYTSRKKNREMILYSFAAPCLNIKEIQGPMSPPRPGNLCMNGGFEIPLSQKSVENRFQFYQENKIPYYRDGQFLLPDCWWLTLEMNEPPKIFMDERNPIAEKYSLFYDASTAQSPSKINNSIFFPVVKGSFSLYARGEGNTACTLVVSFLSKDQTTGQAFSLDTLQFIIQPGKLYQIYGTIPEVDVSQGNTMTVFLEVRNGALSLDQVEIIPEEIDNNGN